MSLLLKVSDFIIVKIADPAGLTFKDDKSQSANAPP
jgi:hypothetical protein